MAFGGYLQANTAVDLMVGPFVDETDGKTAETGLTITQAEVRLSKNGGNMAQKNEATALAHDELGNYMCKLDTTDTNTEGILTLMVHETGALPIKMDYMVLTQAAYISLITAKDTGFMDTNVKTVTAGIIANASFNADVGSTAHGTNIIALAVRKILEELNLDHLLKVDTTVAADGDLEAYVVAGIVLAHLMSANKDVTGFKCTTDSLEAIKVHADTIKAETASIQTETTALDTLTKAAGDGDLAAVLLDTAEIGAAVGASISADVAAVKAETALIVGDTNELQTDNIPGTLATIAAYLDTEIAAIVAAVITNAAGADVAADIIALKAVADAIQVVTDNQAAASTTLIEGTVSHDNEVATTTVIYSDDVTEATADHYNGRLFVPTGAGNALLGQYTDITDYELVSGEGKFTVTALTEAPADNTTFVII